MSDAPAEHEQKIGRLIDSLGITATIEPDALVSGAVVLLKTVLANGDVRLSLCHSDGLSWIERAGMIHLADGLEASSAAGAVEPGA